MNVSVFEILMLLCFACSWPFSIVKALRTIDDTAAVEIRTKLERFRFWIRAETLVRLPGGQRARHRCQRGLVWIRRIHHARISIVESPRP